MSAPINILLVDDDDIEVKNVQRAFRKAGIESPLYIANDGLEALEMLADNKIPTERRVVLLDLNMPRMNGLQFLEQLRATPTLRATPVVVLTTSNDERDRQAAFAFNVAGYLLKPFTSKGFVELIEALHRYWSLVEFPA